MIPLKTIRQIPVYHISSISKRRIYYNIPPQQRTLLRALLFHFRFFPARGRSLDKRAQSPGGRGPSCIPPGAASFFVLRFRSSTNSGTSVAAMKPPENPLLYRFIPPCR